MTIELTPLQDRVYRYLSQEYDPGVELPSLSEIARQVGASPPGVRSVMQSLMVAGLLVGKPRQHSIGWIYTLADTDESCRVHNRCKDIVGAVRDYETAALLGY